MGQKICNANTNNLFKDAPASEPLLVWQKVFLLWKTMSFLKILKSLPHYMYHCHHWMLTKYNSSTTFIPSQRLSAAGFFSVFPMGEASASSGRSGRAVYFGRIGQSGKQPLLLNICSPAHEPMFIGGVNLCSRAHEPMFVFEGLFLA